MLNLLGYTFTALATWSTIDHEYVAAVAFAVAGVAAFISLAIKMEG